MQTNPIILLSPEPKSIWFKLKVFIFGTIWIFRPIETKKTWKEFYYGLIKHKCEFDYSNPKSDKESLKYHNLKYYECKHHGCNMVTYNLNQTNSI